MRPPDVSSRRRRAANVAAIVVILLAGALSASWAFIVPIFQATDEAAHFDYAISIFSAGRLVGTRGATAAWIVSPYTRYLLRASDYFEIAFHSSIRAPKGYGTLAFYRHLDSGAPSLIDPVPAHGSVSYIASTYPFAFYALEALWMKAIAATTGSLTAMFFGARLLCVFLTMLGLYFAYRAALNIGVPPWLGVALVVAAGFFPLTTLVSSYVQPDNLAFTLVSASLFFATQLRVARRPFATTVSLGISLGLLAITKYHFFLGAAIPIALLVLVRLWHERPRLTAAFARLLALTIPAIALLSVQLALLPPQHTLPPGTPPSNGLLGSLWEVARTGVGPTLAYLLTNSAKAILDFFVTGPNVVTYWGELGLWDAPLVVVNEQVELALRIFIAFASVAVAVVIGYRVLRNSAILGKFALRGRGVRAALIATSDPVLSSYALFVVLMFGLYVASNNVFGAAGRQWCPYIFAAFLCAAWYAPRTVPRLRARGPAVAAIGLAIYALVASGYATAAVIGRYYGASDASLSAVHPRPAQIVAGHALGSLWPVQGMDFHPLATSNFRDVFPIGARLWAGGAAIFPASQSAASAVAVVVDNRLAAATVSRLYNFQIAEATRRLAYGYSGFFGTFGTSGLTEGAHIVRAYAREPHSEVYQEIPPARMFFLASGSGFSGAFLHRLQSAPIIDGTLDDVEACPHSILARGTLGGAAGANHDSVVWLLVDSTPYEAHYAEDGRSFWGSVSRLALAPGPHTVSAFIAEPQYSRYWRISGVRKVVVASQPRQLHLAWDDREASAACDEANR